MELVVELKWFSLYVIVKTEMMNYRENNCNPFRIQNALNAE